MRNKNRQEAIERAKSKKEPLVFFDKDELSDFSIFDLPLMGDYVPEGWERGLHPFRILDVYSLEEFRRYTAEIEEFSPPDFVIGYGVLRGTPFGLEVSSYIKQPSLPKV